MRDTNPCDEDTKDTGNSEQWGSTRDRLAQGEVDSHLFLELLFLVEETLERFLRIHAAAANQPRPAIATTAATGGVVAVGWDGDG
jgi:hypothetical protein